MIDQFKVIIPINVKPHPDKFEEEVARILANKFRSDIVFVPRGIGHTPDIQIVSNQEYWEIKNIRGNAKKTIEDNLRRGAKQSSNIVISLLRSKMTAEQASVRIRYYLNHASSSIDRVILVTKRGKTIDFCV